MTLFLGSAAIMLGCGYLPYIEDEEITILMSDHESLAANHWLSECGRIGVPTATGIEPPDRLGLVRLNIDKFSANEQNAFAKGHEYWQAVMIVYITSRLVMERQFPGAIG